MLKQSSATLRQGSGQKEPKSLQPARQQIRNKKTRKKKQDAAKSPVQQPLPSPAQKSQGTHRRRCSRSRLPSAPPKLPASRAPGSKASQKSQDLSSFQAHAASSAASAGETATSSLNFSQASHNSPCLLEKNEFKPFYPSQERAKQ